MINPRVVACVVAIDPGARGTGALLVGGSALLDAVNMPGVVVKAGGQRERAARAVGDAWPRR